ncbi:MAG TPA: SDR family NAD(P)-dependent oxidoreductase, partial [Blastocatellia bacterium]|nr:SDR family NAD(P)-dependent oxidoreductase [Blastocatellia bacterium]
VAFLFPGGGAQYANMAIGLYLDEPVFREQIDLCSELLRSHLNLDLRQIMYTSQQNQPEQAADHLLKPSLGLPALFATEYALAQLWMAWGIRPQVMIGHSLGEYAAACLAGVISLEDALALVALRGQLFEELPEGRMLSIPLSEHELRPYLDRQFSIAAINHPNACVVSGAAAAIEQLEAALAETQIESRRLHISVAAHSTLVEPILDRFRDFISRIELRPPQIPFLSNLTGSWITPKEATDPEYWVKHLRLTVRFASGAQELFRNAELMLLEVGPGNTLASLVQQHPAKSARQEVCCSVRHPNDSQPDSAFLLATLGRLWVAGVKIDWRQFYAGQQRRRTTLPATPFDRKRYWIEADPAAHLLQPATTAAPSKRPDLAEWFYAPSWRRKPVHALPLAPTGSRLFFMDETGFGESLARQLRTGQQFLITVRPGRDFERVGEDAYSLDPADPDHYQELLRRLKSAGHLPQQIVHAWSLQPTAPGKTPDDDPQPVDQMEQRGFYSLLYLAQAWKRLGSAPVRITMLTNYTQDVTGEEPLQPEKATVLGPIKAISQECPEIACRAIDLEFPNAASSDAPETSLIKALEAEISASETEMFVAYRGSGNYRWVLNYEPMRLPVLPDRLREHGVYLITGGTGGVGRLLAQYLAGAVQARLALLGRHARSVDPEVIHEIEKAGGEVLLLDADVANQPQMQAAIDQTLARFGMIHGVIHAAGITTGNSLFRPFEEMDAEACEAQFQPKIHGLRVLEKMLAWQKLDFVLLISSNASVLGGLGLVAYSAANHVLDLFATRQSRRGSTPWISANWDGWPTERRQRIDGTHTSIDKYAMTPEECREAFRRIASLCRGQVVVSSGDLAARLQRWTQLQSEPEAESPAPPLKGGPPAPEAVPRDEVEQRLAELWREMLGVEQVGRYDNFFELRGDSLLGTRLITRLNRLFGVELPLRGLFEDPTIAGLAERVEASRRHVPESLKRPADPVGAEEEEVR